MPVQLPRASPADFVMTRPWSHTARLHPHISEGCSGSSRTSSAIAVTSWSPILSSSSSSPSLSRSRKLSAHSSQSRLEVSETRVGKLLDSRLWLRLFLLVLLYQPVVSKPWPSLPPGVSRPWSNMQPGFVVFRSRICQSVTRSNLQKMISPYFDKNRMATDLATGKRTYGPTYGEVSNPGYQADEPILGLAVQSADLVEGDREWSSNDDLWVDEREDVLENTENRMIEEIDESDVFDRRTWIPRRKVLNRRVPNKSSNVSNLWGYLRNKNDLSNGQSYTTSSSDPYAYMKRRRRRSLDLAEASSQSAYPDSDIPSLDEDVDENINFDEYDFGEENSETDKKSVDNIQLRLFLRGKDKKTRKLLKKKLRQKAKNLIKPPPWECKFTQVNKHMRTGIFPDTVLDGRCETDKCFYRLYNCEPIKYVMKMLQRDPDQCNPLPSLSNETTYEERWNLIQYHVTVGCKCTSPTTKNSKPKNRRRD
ncbi:unnamed protein product [Candidula unifasciata]|uniref:Uncharacterized protein n=1 Tax=Candidula unifasciata TaxID=100452 RepID=A0A8S3ZQE5_9EUPU|nr:unnamed protein product [Candidula unifasciata]